jgi:predicted ATP-grasp superfamily ATP-dependent carboligase
MPVLRFRAMAADAPVHDAAADLAPRPERRGGDDRHRDVEAVVLGDLNLLWPVGLAGLRAIVVSPDPKPHYSRYCAGSVTLTSSRQDPARAAAELCALGEGLHGRPVLYYETDAELAMVSRHREALGRSYRLLLPPVDLVEQCLDKARFAGLAARCGLPVPRTVPGEAVDEVRRLALPCALKPVRRPSWDGSEVARTLPRGQKAVKLETAEARDRWMAEMTARGQRFVVQEWVPGADGAIHSYHAYLDERSTPLAWFVGRKIRTSPPETGRSTCLELAREPELEALALGILRALRFTGVVKMDFKRHAGTGRFYLLEINARFNMWHYLGAVCGVNLPAVAHAHLTGAPPPTRRDVRHDVRWISLLGDLRAGLAGVRHGRWSVGAWLGSYGRRRVYSSLSWRDPVPVVMGTLAWLGVPLPDHALALVHRPRLPV